jgi:hypothetical protein
MQYWEQRFFKPAIGNESLNQEDDDDNDDDIVVTSKVFPHRNIYQYTWTSSDW